MKKVILATLILLATATLFAQNIEGQWNGVLDIQGTQLRLVFNITKTATGIAATMDSPDQGAKGLATTSARFEKSVLTIVAKNMQMTYVGTLDATNTIKGKFKQGGMALPLTLTTAKTEEKALVRPQEPAKPYPYYTEEVTFENVKDKITLAGTLSLPKKEGKFPVVVLISGSGPQNRDEELFGHKPFLVLADYLTKNGIGVLRYDDRGTASSKGDFQTATTADFATDVEAAVSYLTTRKDVNVKRIGLIGHSEGGIIAPIVATKSKYVNFVVLLAGTGIQGDKLLLLQAELIEKAMGETPENIKKHQKINKGAFEIVTKAKTTEGLKMDLSVYFKEKMTEMPDMKPKDMSDEDFVNTQVNGLASPWIQYFVSYDPFPLLKDVKCPVLAINGSKDLQVPATVNLEAIKRGLEAGGNRNVTTKELPNLNHLFQECTTGSPEEYGKIEQTFSPVALNEVLSWILKQVK